VALVVLGMAVQELQTLAEVAVEYMMKVELLVELVVLEL
tara:strand:- start:147 stop:263 length:117 start_codon:yes stop_codon:yes gene_type:complete